MTMLRHWSLIERLAGAGLILLGAGLLGSIYLEWQAPSLSVEALIPPPRADVPAGRDESVQAMQPIARFSAITERPLFSPDRRPAEETEDETGPLSDLRLAGIVISPASREALIVHGAPPAIVHLKEGEAVDGWTVRQIDPGRVVLSSGGERHELRLLPRGAEP